jgi:predicted esterase
MPFTVGFHGASGNPKAGLRVFGRYADRRGIVVLCPGSQFPSWDVLYGGFGPDVATIDDAVQRVFDRMTVDRMHLAATGFSDGASYALSLALINGDLFSHVVALSPGFHAPGPEHGKPEVFIAHGTEDRVLPIARTSRRIVPQLRSDGYDVHYQEFSGRHEVVPSVTRGALHWFLD